MPLASLLAADQSCPLQVRQVRRDGGLGQPAALVDLPGANAMLVVVDLIGELRLRVFQPVEDVSPYWVRQGFYISSRSMDMAVMLGFVKRYIAMRRTLNRYIPIRQYDFGLKPD